MKHKNLPHRRPPGSIQEPYCRFLKWSASACLAARRWLVIASRSIFSAFPAASRLGQSGSPLLHFLL